MDDITIFSDTNEYNIRDIRQVCHRLQDHTLRALPSKYKFFANKHPLLGHVIEDQGIYQDSVKIRGIQDWYTPKSKNWMTNVYWCCNIPCTIPLRPRYPKRPTVRSAFPKSIWMETTAWRSSSTNQDANQIHYHTPPHWLSITPSNLHIYRCF